MKLLKYKLISLLISRVFKMIIFILFQEIIQDRDEERERLRRELQRAQEQVHTLMSHSSVRTSSLSVTSPTSRPASYISIEESSGPETSERNLESEDDGKKSRIFFP